MTAIDAFGHGQDRRRRVTLVTSAFLAGILHLSIFLSANCWQTKITSPDQGHKSVAINLVSLPNFFHDMSADSSVPEAVAPKEILPSTASEKKVETKADLPPARKMAEHVMPAMEKRGKKKQNLPERTSSKQLAKSGKTKQEQVKSEAVQASATKNYTGTDSAPAPIEASRNRKPVYPELARQRGQEGLVILLARIDGTGRLTGLDVSKSSGYPMLDAAAVKAVRQWHFKPAIKAGVAVDGTVSIPVEFRLR